MQDFESYFKKIPKQKYLRDNAEGIAGDCWRCCIAAIINKPAEEVPHFVEEVAKGRLKSTSADTQAWLNKQGYALVQCYVSSLYGALCISTWSGQPPVPIPIMECGPTVRSKSNVGGPSENHCVVTIHGNVVYDPHPSEAGLLATIERYLIVPIPQHLK